MKKRVLSLFMTLALCLTSLPLTALAEEQGVPNSTATVATVNGGSAPGETEAGGETKETGVEGEAGIKGESGETGADSTPDASMSSVQDMINALPDVDALSAMEEDELLAAYMAIQEAYAAYDALTAEQQAEITGADCFEELFGWFNGQIAPQETISYGIVDTETGERMPWSVDRTGGTTIDDKTEDVGTAVIDTYLLKEDVTLDSLTVKYLQGAHPVLYLGKNTTLTIQGPIIFQSGAFLTVYGAEDGSGKIIIENNSDSAAIQTEGESNSSYLAIGGGELEIRSKSGRITDGVALLNGTGYNQTYMEYKVDGKPLVYNENRELLRGKTITGKELTLTWCDHKSEYVTYESSDETQHKMKCAQCGFVGDAVNCEFVSPDGPNQGDDNGHYATCACGNVDKTKQIAHDWVAQATEDGKMHTSACRECGYVMKGAEKEAHKWDTTTGECKICSFMPVARDSLGNLYDGNNDGVTTALAAVADGNGAAYVELYSEKTDDKEISEAVEFGHPDKTVTLNMNGYTLNSTMNPALEVSDGTLKITGDGMIKSGGQSPELVNSAISVSGGKLIFENNLTAEGGYWSKTRKPAVTADGGELEFKAGLDLNGGLTLTGNAKLTKGLTQGTFWAEDDTNDSARVSVEGSNVYNNVYGLLADGYAFVKKDATDEFVDANAKKLTEDVTIVAHTHDYQLVAGSDEYKCACGLTCSHPNGYDDDGKCSVCGKPCPHANVNESDYTCKGCGKQMLVKIKKDDLQTYGTDFAAAMNEAEDGVTITLLADINNSGKRAYISGDGKTVILNLNGHTITDGWIWVGTNNEYTSCTLKIIGKGSYVKTGVVGNVGVWKKATLDLSGWTGGTISLIQRNNVDYSSESEWEPGIIVGPDAGTIQYLLFPNNKTLSAAKKTHLSGGSYEKIEVTGQNPIQLGDLLAAGYAFQNADGTYVEYTEQIKESAISNVKVVKCPHDKIENDTCAYCNMTGIVATLDGKTYTSSDSTIDAAVTDWLSNGGVLRLYSDYSDVINFSSATKPLTIDLNGHKFNNGLLMNLSSASLTIRDTSETGNGKFGKLEADKGTLILESGTLESLAVPENSSAAISLRGGKFTAGVINTSFKTYRMLEGGYYLLHDSSTPVNPAKAADGPNTDVTYQVKKADITAGGETSGTIAYGESTVPIKASVSVKESDITHVQFLWYAVTDNGAVMQLAASEDVELSGDKTASYAPGAADRQEYPGWNSLNVGTTYDLICVVTGKDSKNSIQWHTVWTGYQMKVEKANLNSEKTVITQTENSGNTGNPADNRLVVKPNAYDQYGKILDDVTYQFDVSYNGKKLTQNTDYTIKGNSNTAKNAGEYELTIVGTGNYTGEKTITWTIEPYELSGKHVPTQIDKTYDGTNTADETVQGVMGLGSFEIDSSNLRNPKVQMDGIYLNNSVDKTDMHFDSAEVGDRTFYFTLTLKDDNYVFANGTKTAKFELSRQKTSDPAVAISKESVTAPAAKYVSVVNGHAATYTLDLAGLLPTLDSPMKYGEVQYSMDSVILDSDYYTTKNAAYIEDGKLKLPILASTQTGDVNVGTITVKVNSDNISEFILTIKVKASDKIVPALNGELNLSKTELTYGDLLSTITISGTMTDPTTNETVQGTFAWDTPDQKMDTVGKYDAAWKFVPDNTSVYAEATGKATITVIKATPAGEPTYTAITASGKKLSDAALTASDKWPAGTLEWIDGNDKPLSEDTEVMVNTTYRWQFTPTDSNYNILAGEIELYHVDAPAITSQPKNVSVVTGERAVFEVAAMGTALTYQWKIDRNDGKGFVDIAGANSASYTTGATDADCNGFKYQCVISNAAGSVTTDTAVLTVKEKYTITATAGEHGSISPSGAVEVVEGSKQTFVITAEEGYEIESLTVDGKSVDIVTSYTFENVTAAHTIAVTFKQQYKIIEGADSSWTQSTDGSLVIRGDGEIGKFVNVKVDGTIIDPTNYEVTEGSTIITLKPEFLKTLSEGSHTFEIAWTDGTASTSFTVAKNTSGSDDTGSNDNDDSNKDSNDDSSNNNSGSNNTAGSGDNIAQTLTGSPNTGDASGLWITLFLASAAGLAVMLVRRKKQ